MLLMSIGNGVRLEPKIPAAGLKVPFHSWNNGTVGDPYVLQIRNVN